MTRYRNPLDTASAMIITSGRQIATRLSELSALSEVGSKKATFETMLSRQVANQLPAKAKSPKSLILFQGIDCIGGDPPLPAASRMPMVIYSFECHNDNNGDHDQRWGPSLIPLYGIAGKRCKRVPIGSAVYAFKQCGLDGLKLCLEFT